MRMNIDTAKSYATEKALMKAIEKNGWNDAHFIVVVNRTGRYTALFSFYANFPNGGYVGLFSSKGFITL